MPKLNPDALEELMKAAGVSGRAAKSMREANDPKPDQQARGHGAPSQEIDPILEI